jgi:hypothetical protein
MFLLVSAEAVLRDTRVVAHLILGEGGDGKGVEAALRAAGGQARGWQHRVLVVPHQRGLRLSCKDVMKSIFLKKEM